MRDKLYEAILAVVELADCTYEEVRKAMYRVLHNLYDAEEL